LLEYKAKIMRERLPALAAKQAITARSCHAPVPDVNLSMKFMRMARGDDIRLVSSDSSICLWHS
jgi:hypothetical protein